MLTEGQSTQDLEVFLDKKQWVHMKSVGRLGGMLGDVIEIISPETLNNVGLLL